MTSTRSAHLLTISLLAILAAGVSWRRYSTTAPAEAAANEPRDAIYAMFDAERQGNAREYLGSYTGQLKASLEQTAKEMGETSFGRSLRERNSPVKGFAISEPEAISEREVKAKVEYVYADRNEAQIFYLQKDGGSWKIAKIDGADRVKTLVPYGTPVQ